MVLREMKMMWKISVLRMLKKRMWCWYFVGMVKKEKMMIKMKMLFIERDFLMMNLVRNFSVV